MILVRSFPRIHIGLLDASGSGQRTFGGSGFMLDSLPIEVAIGCDPPLGGDVEIDQAGRSDIESAVARMGRSYRLKPGFMSITSLPPQHIGLGSKTALLLGVLKAWERHSGLEVGERQLQLLSGRGGTSGVGIHGFFKGGFVVDAGHPAAAVQELGPSAARRPADVPLLTVGHRVDESWRFTLLLPKGHRYSGGAEVEFFRRNTPIPSSESQEAISITYHGVVPAVLSNDLGSLRTALKAMQACGFKKRELQGQTDGVRTLIGELNDIPGCAVGMSSMGPLIYVIADHGMLGAKADIEDCASRSNAAVLACCPARNLGYEVRQ